MIYETVGCPRHFYYCHVIVVSYAIPTSMHGLLFEYADIAGQAKLDGVNMTVEYELRQL